MPKEFKQEMIDTLPTDAEELLDLNVFSGQFDPKMDFVFKAIFTQHSEESRLARIDFLSALLGLAVIEATVLENELAVTNDREKNSTFDLHAKLSSGEEVNVEIQVKNNDNMINRSEYLCCKLFGSQDAKGKEYGQLDKVYEVMIVNFTLFSEREGFVDQYVFRNAEGRVLSGNTNIIFLELTKLASLLTKPVDELTSQEMWAVFLKFGNDEKRQDLIRTIKEKREGIKMASTILDTISHDRAMQLAYIDRLMFEIDQVSKIGFAKRQGLEEGLEKGLEKGREEGLEEGIRVMAKKLRLRGMDIAYIAEDTGLSIDEINSL